MQKEFYKVTKNLYPLTTMTLGAFTTYNLLQSVTGNLYNFGLQITLGTIGIVILSDLYKPFLNICRQHIGYEPNLEHLEVPN